MVQTRLHKHSLSKKEQAVSGVASRASVRDPIDKFQEVYGSRAGSAAFRQQLGSDFSRSPQFQPPIQAKPSFRGLSQELAAESQSVQLREDENKTGLPDNLKAGVEALSGFSMDDVRVHYNSSKPAQLQALAYTQGTEIHVGPGQEEHLPHEAWHVVQQMQGRVKPTMQMKGVQINDDQGLEREADIFAIQALQQGQKKREVLCEENQSNLNFSTSSIVQRIKIKAYDNDLDTEQFGEFVQFVQEAREKKDHGIIMKIYSQLNDYVQKLDFSLEDKQDEKIFRLLSITKQAKVQLEELPKELAVKSQILSFPKSEWWRLFIDTRYHGKAQEGLLFDYESSPGYYNAMLTAFEEVFSPQVPKEPAQKSFFVGLWQSLMKEQASLKQEEKQITAQEYKSYHEKVRKTVLTKLNESLYTNISSGWSGKGVDFAMNELGDHYSEPSLQALKELIEDGIITMDPKSDILDEERKLKSNPDAPIEIEVITEIETQKRLFRCHTKYETDKSEGIVNDILLKYYEDLKKAQSIEDKNEQQNVIVKTIARVIRNLHVGHFFPDANGRINIMLLLNKFLIDNDMPPVILTENPGVFGGLKTLEELVEIINTGQENFNKTVLSLSGSAK